MNADVFDDLYRLTGKRDRKTLKRALMYNDGFRFLYFWRHAQEGRGIKRKICVRIVKRIERRTGIEIPHTVRLGAGALLLHPTAITINSAAVIGKNCVLLKGCTIGNQKRGTKAGAPVIGENVYIGLNSTVVGGIHIGNDVLVAPNTYVNFDVPDHSIVLGSPGKIYPRDNATEAYIENRI